MPRYVLNSPLSPPKWLTWVAIPCVDTAWNLDGRKMPTRSLTNVSRGWMRPETWRGPKISIAAMAPPSTRLTTPAAASPRRACGVWARQVVRPKRIRTAAKTPDMITVMARSSELSRSCAVVPTPRSAPTRYGERRCRTSSSYSMASTNTGKMAIAKFMCESVLACM